MIPDFIEILKACLPSDISFLGYRDAGSVISINLEKDGKILWFEGIEFSFNDKNKTKKHIEDILAYAEKEFGDTENCDGQTIEFKRPSLNCNAKVFNDGPSSKHDHDCCCRKCLRDPYSANGIRSDIIS